MTGKTVVSLDDLKISQHAKERYSERIMGRDNKADVNTFIIKNDEKIKTDISKMIEYGQVIFSGKPIDLYNKQPVHIILNGTWVVIVDQKKTNVVTLYSIDLGLGDDFNKQYIDRLMDKLNAAKSQLSETLTKIDEQVETYKKLIDENDAIIAENRKLIKALEQQNEAYNSVISTLVTTSSASEKDVREIVGVMIGKKVF